MCVCACVHTINGSPCSPCNLLNSSLSAPHVSTTEGRRTHTDSHTHTALVLMFFQYVMLQWYCRRWYSHSFNSERNHWVTALHHFISHTPGFAFCLLCLGLNSAGNDCQWYNCVLQCCGMKPRNVYTSVSHRIPKMKGISLRMHCKRSKGVFQCSFFYLYMFVTVRDHLKVCKYIH